MSVHKLKPIFSQLISEPDYTKPVYSDLIRVKSFSDGSMTAVCKSTARSVKFQPDIKVWVYTNKL